MVKVAVVGSINMDVVNQVARHPLPGETVQGLGTTYSPGGKGANQAVAAAQAGGQVTMIGAVGTDAFGPRLVDNLAAHGVDTGVLLRIEGSSGLAFITVDATGENNIILSGGSNAKLSIEHVQDNWNAVTNADVLLLQNEIPWETTRWALEAAHQHGIRVIFNPAPAFAVPSALLAFVDVLVVNETEAEAIVGIEVTDLATAEAACRKLLAGGARAVVLTLGPHGAVYAELVGAATAPGDGDGDAVADAGATGAGGDAVAAGAGGAQLDSLKVLHQPAFVVPVADTTAAGDTFIGAFAVELCSGVSPAEALRFAAAASAVKVTRHGAQSSIPSRSEVEAFLAEQLRG